MKKILTTILTILVLTSMTQAVSAASAEYGPVLRYETEFRAIDITNVYEREIERKLILTALANDSNAHDFDVRIQEVYNEDGIWKNAECTFVYSNGKKGWLCSLTRRNWAAYDDNK